MEMKIWTLASDDDNGTQAAVFTTEREAQIAHITAVFEGNEQKLKAALDLYAKVQEGDEEAGDELDAMTEQYLRGSLCTYSVDEHVIEIPDGSILAVIQEFIRDVDAAGGPAQVGEDWPDLIVTYNKAKAAIAAKPQPPRIVVILEDGLIGDVVSNVPVELASLDFDTDGADEDELTVVPTRDGEPKKAFGLIRSVDQDASYSAGVFAALAGTEPTPDPATDPEGWKTANGMVPGGTNDAGRHYGPGGVVVDWNEKERIGEVERRSAAAGQNPTVPENRREEHSPNNCNGDCKSHECLAHKWNATPLRQRLDLTFGTGFACINWKHLTPQERSAIVLAVNSGRLQLPEPQSHVAQPISPKPQLPK